MNGANIGLPARTCSQECASSLHDYVITAIIEMMVIIIVINLSRKCTSWLQVLAFLNVARGGLTAFYRHQRSHAASIRECFTNYMASTVREFKEAATPVTLLIDTRYDTPGQYFILNASSTSSGSWN